MLELPVSLLNGGPVGPPSPAWVMYWGLLLPWWLAAPSLTWWTLATREAGTGAPASGAFDLAGRRLGRAREEDPLTAASFWLVPLLGLGLGGSGLALAIARVFGPFESGMFVTFAAAYLLLGSTVAVLVVVGVLPFLVPGERPDLLGPAREGSSRRGPSAVIGVGLAMALLPLAGMWGPRGYLLLGWLEAVWRGLPLVLLPAGLLVMGAGLVLLLSRRLGGSAETGEPTRIDGELAEPYWPFSVAAILGGFALVWLVPSPGWPILAGAVGSSVAGVGVGAALAGRGEGSRASALGLVAAYVVQLPIGWGLFALA